MLSAIVLAAGSSTRMNGSNKLLLPYKNRSMISHVIEQIISGGIENIIIVLGYDAENVRRCLEYLPVEFIKNSDHLMGMTSSIQKGVSISKSDGYMICLADMIKITGAEYELFKKTFEEQYLVNNKCICIPVYMGKYGNPVIFSSYYKDLIQQHKITDGCKEIITANLKHLIMIPISNDHVHFDVDLPEDYQNLKE